VKSVQPRASRLVVTLGDEGHIDREAMAALAPRGFAVAAPKSLHILIGPDADGWASELEPLLAG
jgi:hypothetical protein